MGGGDAAATSPVRLEACLAGGEVCATPPRHRDASKGPCADLILGQRSRIVPA
jgi:hypothetical protein